MSHEDDEALLKAYISEWRKFFAQCSYLPMPFNSLESALMGKSSTTNSQAKKLHTEESIVRKVAKAEMSLRVLIFEYQ